MCTSDCKVPSADSRTVSGNNAQSKPLPIIDFSITRFMRFLKHIRINHLLKQVTDPRDPIRTKYRLEFLLGWALSVFFFRTESLNGFQQALDKVPLHKRQALWNFFGLPENSSLPCRQTVSDLLAYIAPEEINILLIRLFQWAIKSKIFYNHKHALGTAFGLACDGVVTHHYTSPHAIDEKGENACPYCLARTRNKGTPEEQIYWLHAFVNVAVILPGGVQLPIYVHALNAEQARGHEDASDAKHKQECELQSAKIILTRIRQAFPKQPFILQCDSLYANEPFLQLCRELQLEFLIVRQEGSLKNLAKRCNALKKTEIYQSYRDSKTISSKNGSKIVKTSEWFNREYVGAQEVHVIRFSEAVFDEQGNRTHFYKTEWLSSMRIFKKNCFEVAQIARRRADHEDLHNTLKNRGFNAKHDYVRSHANAALIWKLLMFVAFWIFELFSCTVLAQESKNSLSWRAFAKELLIDLLREPWEFLQQSPSLRKKRMQFRWNFSGH